MDKNKFLGVIFGAALGDAVGYYNEFYFKNQLKQMYPTQESFTFPPTLPLSFMKTPRKIDCDWTDDTDHIVLLMEMLVETHNKIDACIFAKKLTQWVSCGFQELGDTKGFGCGAHIASIVSNPDFIKIPYHVSKITWKQNHQVQDGNIMRQSYHNFCSIPNYSTSINKLRRQASNGSLMRTCIMACRNLNYETTISEAVAMSKCTHYDPRCSVGVAVITSILWDCLYNSDISDLLILDRAYAMCEKYGEDFINETRKWFLINRLEDMELDYQIGYVLKCMSVGVWVFRNRHRSYKELLLEIVLAGGDTDTNATVMAIWGALYGFEALPQDWIEKLPHFLWLETKCNDFYKMLI